MANTKHYADADGTYLGGFGDGARPPEGAIETPAPLHGKMRWTGSKWVMPLGAARELATLSRADFAVRAAAAGYVDPVDARNWAAGASIPAKLQAHLDAMEAAGEIDAMHKLRLEIASLTAQEVPRLSGLMPIVIAAFETDDAGADVLFGIGEDNE